MLRFFAALTAHSFHRIFAVSFRKKVDGLISNQRIFNFFLKVIISVLREPHTALSHQSVPLFL